MRKLLGWFKALLDREDSLTLAEREALAVNASLRGVI